MDCLLSFSLFWFTIDIDYTISNVTREIVAGQSHLLRNIRFLFSLAGHARSHAEEQSGNFVWKKVGQAGILTWPIKFEYVR